MRKLRLLLAIFALPLVFAVTASAATVVHGVEQVHNTFFSGPLSNACGFPIYITDEGTIRFTDFLDEGGLIVKDIAEINLWATIVNPANGKTATSHDNRVDTLVGEDLFGPNEVIFSDTTTGVIFNVTIPGHGATAQLIGRVVVEDGVRVFKSGPRLVTSDIPEFCGYMADP